MVSNKKDKYHKYLRSEEWAKIKTDLIILNDGKCEECGSRKNLQVHHLTYKNLFHEEPGDLVLLCGKCHMAVHGIAREKKPAIHPRYNKFTLRFLRKKLAQKLSTKIKCGHGWIELARQTAALHGETFSGGKAAAKTYIKKKVL